MTIDTFINTWSNFFVRFYLLIEMCGIFNWIWEDSLKKYYEFTVTISFLFYLQKFFQTNDGSR